MGKPVTLEGKTFKSVKEAAKYYNLDYNTVYGRLWNGWSIEEAFELVNIDSKKKGKEITLEGKTFKSATEAAKYYNLVPGTINVRLNRGWSIEEAFELVERDNDYNCKPITIEGKTFKSITEAAKYYNLVPGIVNTRLNRGWSIEEAFGLVERDNNYNCKPITIEGKTFTSIAEACRYYNLIPGTVNTRLNRGWSIEEAFKLIDRNDLCKPITVNSKTFDSIKEAVKYYNLAYETVYARLRYGWSIEEAFELVDIDSKNTAKEITIEGKTFDSIKEAAKYYNLAHGIVYVRLNRGWSIEEAFGLVPRQKKKK